MARYAVASLVAPDKWQSNACPHCGGLGRFDGVNPAWLRWVRLQAGVPLREVARLAGFSAPFVSDVEHGRRNCNETLFQVYAKLEPRR